MGAVVSLTVGFLHKSACHDVVRVEDEQWRLACYSDILPLYTARGLAEGLWPYLQADVEYPVLTAAFMAAVGLPVSALSRAGVVGPTAAGLLYYWITAAVLALLALLTVWVMLRLRAHRVRDVWLLVVAPGFAVATGLNWDMLAVALMVLGLLAWVRERPLAAGALLGLAGAAKLFPLFLLGPLVVLAWRARRAGGLIAARRLLLGAVTSWLIVNVPAALLAPAGWAEFYRFSSDRGIDRGTLWHILGRLPVDGTPLGAAIDAVVTSNERVNIASLALFALACTGIAVLILRARTPPRVASVAFLVVAAFLLTNKVWSPQFTLWLLPLAVLARPRWELFLAWQAAYLAYHVTVFRSFLFEAGAPFALQLTAIGRWVAVAALVGVVLAEALHPHADAVRDPDGSDPDAGPLRFTRPLDEVLPGGTGPGVPGGGGLGSLGIPAAGPRPVFPGRS